MDDDTIKKCMADPLKRILLYLLLVFGYECLQTHTNTL